MSRSDPNPLIRESVNRKICLITEKDLLAAISPKDVITAIKDAYIEHWADPDQNLPRRRIRITGGIYHTMSAYSKQYNLFATKSYVTLKTGATKFIVTAISALDPSQLFLFEADHLGRLRTAASTILAIKTLNPSAEHVALIGAGKQGETHLKFLNETTSIKKVFLFSKTSDKTKQLADKLKNKTNFEVVVSSSLKSSIENCDTIITATYSKEPLISTQNAKLETIKLICAIGANYRTRSEVSPDVFKSADLIVVDDTESAQIEGADIGKTVDELAIQWKDLVPFGQVLSENINPGKLSIFKSFGIAKLDAALAGLYLSKKT